MSSRLAHSGYRRNVVRASAVLIVVLLAVALVGYAIAPDGRGALVRLFVNFFITVVIVVGLQVFVGNSGVISYGHSAFVGVGAYVTAWLTIPPDVKTEILPSLPSWVANAEWGFLPSVAAAAVAGSIVAVVIGGAIMRMKETAMAMSTLGLLVIAHGVYSNWEGMTRGSEGVYALPVRTDLWIAFGAAALAVVLALAFKYSRWGLRLQASREDSLAAEATGVSVVRVRYAAWVLSAAISAAAGSVWAQYNLAFAPSQFYFIQVFAALSMLVIGGMTTVSGAVVGAGVTTVLFELMRGVEEEGNLFGIAVPEITGLTQIVLAIITLLILIYRPNGILSWWELDAWVRRARVRFSRGRGSPPPPAEQNAGGG
jgi:branched-chain amino acid transport system permease protein